jgi:hypothetical protein
LESFVSNTTTIFMVRFIYFKQLSIEKRGKK